jgi:hypothetical protein
MSNRDIDVPAPKNLEVPLHYRLNETRLLIGEHAPEA